MKETITLEFDGGSRGNPGPAGVGVVLRAKDGTPLLTLGRFIGRATNNVAEYNALIVGLEKAKELGATALIVRGDSELIIRQMSGVYRVKHPDLRPLHAKASALADSFQSVKYEHRLREGNVLADKLVNRAIDRKADVGDADGFDPPSSPSPASPPARSTRPAAASGAARPHFSCNNCGCEIEVVRPSSQTNVGEVDPFRCVCGQEME